MAAQLDSLGCGYQLPEGAFFIMVDIRPTGLDSWTFARRLLVEGGVGVVPGAAFGNGGEGFVRVTLAAAEDVLEDGVARLGDFVRALRRELTRGPTGRGGDLTCSAAPCGIVPAAGPAEPAPAPGL